MAVSGGMQDGQCCMQVFHIYQHATFTNVLRRMERVGGNDDMIQLARKIIDSLKNGPALHRTWEISKGAGWDKKIRSEKNPNFLRNEGYNPN